MILVGFTMIRFVVVNHKSKVKGALCWNFNGVYSGTKPL